MPDEQNPDAAMANNSGRQPSLSAIVTSRAATEMHGEENRAVVRFNEDHVSALIALQASEQENADRRSEREHSDRKHARNWGAALVGMVILAVTAVVIILIYQGILDFLREMAMIVIPALGGIGVEVVIGFRMGIRYSNSRNRQ